ncbi:hypothetical protein C1I95_10885 [Micromonospora craterilacus]|uniref:Uncharacterized protein n=2 Tax=Micromonospora craterilacus TaxID=1655439 RepID=A0A2W2F202_9ACTN|nr:hypothetical protein C1I95_10885 [Micromonospora craterilacus]
MAALPPQVRTEVLMEIVGQMDAARWEELSAPAATDMYNRFVKDPKIGGRLAPFMTAHQIRVWIKDGPAKEYRRALEGIGTIATFTKRTYPGPASVVRLALGDQWSPRPNTIEIKPMRCFADGPTGASKFIIWGPLTALQSLIWNSCLIRANDPLQPITVVITKPNSAPLPPADWELVKALSAIVNANCQQITYAVSRKPGD